MKNSGIEIYGEYSKKVGDRKGIFTLIAERFSIKKAMYPGSYIHITPSLVIPEVIYIDTDKKAIKFFETIDIIMEFIDKNKLYREDSAVKFIAKDYGSDIPVPDKSVDLLISQYAGFISQASKKYLKKGGLLLANDSHGDATMAYMDSDYELIGVIEYSGTEYTIDSDNLDQYFKFKRNRPIDMGKVKEKMKGPKYRLNPEHYVFRKLV